MSKIEAMIEKVKALINAPSCCAEAKEAANKWLEAVNTEKQDEAAKALIEEIAADIIPIDGLIAFAGSEDGKKIFGEEKAAGIEAHAKKIKAEGARFCDCPACTAVAAILADKADLYAPTYSLTWTVTDDDRKTHRQRRFQDPLHPEHGGSYGGRSPGACEILPRRGTDDRRRGDPLPPPGTDTGGNESDSYCEAPQHREKKALVRH